MRSISITLAVFLLFLLRCSVLRADAQPSATNCLAAYLYESINQINYKNEDIFPTFISQPPNPIIFQTKSGKLMLVENGTIAEIPHPESSKIHGKILISDPVNGKMHYKPVDSDSWKFTTMAGLKVSLDRIPNGTSQRFVVRSMGDEVKTLNYALSNEQTDKQFYSGELARLNCAEPPKSVNDKILEMSLPAEALKRSSYYNEKNVISDIAKSNKDHYERSLAQTDQRLNSIESAKAEIERSDDKSLPTQKLTALSGPVAEGLAQDAIRPFKAHYDNQILSKKFDEKLRARCPAELLPQERPLSTDQKLKNGIIDIYDDAENSDYLEQFKESNKPK